MDIQNVAPMRQTDYYWRIEEEKTMAFKDLTGQKFGKLVANEKVINNKYGAAMWKCICDCGNNVIVKSGSLISGHTKSCGCLRAEILKATQKNNITHGMTNTKIFRTYNSMKERCYRKNSISYSYYGGKGITICDEWLNKQNGFQNFYNWAMKNGYDKTLTIDRIDNNKGYSPNNCRWTTNIKQNNNRSNTIKLSHNGKTQTISEWAKDISISSVVIKSRLARNNDIEKILSPYVRPKLEKQSGVKGVTWSKSNKKWMVYSERDGKKHCYIKSFKKLDEAIKFKKDYDSNIGG